MESERKTRSARIDPRLKAAGWHVVPPATDSNGACLAIEEFETNLGPADYALFDGGRCLGVAEAKKLTLGPQGVLVQAERYSKAIEQTPRYQGEFGAPFLYATNGEVLWFHRFRGESWWEPPTRSLRDSSKRRPPRKRLSRREHVGQRWVWQ
jgi:type I restriction enzyme R subunit